MNEPHTLNLDPQGPTPPPMCDAMLDGATLTELFDDLADCTEIIGVQIKAGAQVHAGDAPIPLASARELLRDGKVRGAQIRYRYQGREWCDTIMNLHGCYRLIRCQHQ